MVWPAVSQKQALRLAALPCTAEAAEATEAAEGAEAQNPRVLMLSDVQVIILRRKYLGVHNKCISLLSLCVVLEVVQGQPTRAVDLRSIQDWG